LGTVRPGDNDFTLNAPFPAIADIGLVRHQTRVKVYAVRPVVKAFDGSGTLSSSAEEALRVIADLVVQALRLGGDTSHQAVIWNGLCDVQTSPTMITALDDASLAALVRQCLDPNDLTGGDIRSTVNCRAVTFGQDGQAFLCLRHEDAAPHSPAPTLVTILEEPAWLTETDLFDGAWPAA
jgi:hypothetical protein